MMQLKNNKMAQRVMVIAALTIGLFFVSASLATAQFGPSRAGTAVVWPNGKAYFFKGSQYIRWDLNSARVDSGYPATIASGGPASGLTALMQPSPGPMGRPTSSE